MPHSFVFHRGEIGKNVEQLVMDMRQVMAPYTAQSLKVFNLLHVFSAVKKRSAKWCFVFNCRFLCPVGSKEKRLKRLCNSGRTIGGHTLSCVYKNIDQC